MPPGARPLGPQAQQTQYGPSRAPAAGIAPPYGFQIRRLTLIDQITAAGSVLLFIALWLPWYGVSSAGYSYSIGGINAHSYLAFALLTSVLLMAYLAARAGWDRLPVRLPIAHAPLLLVVGVVQFVIVLIAFLSTPQSLEHSPGAYIALIAAISASLPIVIPAIQASQRR